MFINNAYVHNNSNDRTAWWSGGPRIRPGVVKQMEVLEENLTLVPMSLIVYSLWHNLFIKRFKCKEFQIRVRDLEKVGYLILKKTAAYISQFAIIYHYVVQLSKCPSKASFGGAVWLFERGNYPQTINPSQTFKKTSSSLGLRWSNSFESECRLRHSLIIRRDIRSSPD